jgi:hypothetical protein
MPFSANCLISDSQSEERSALGMRLRAQTRAQQRGCNSNDRRYTNPDLPRKPFNPEKAIYKRMK